jgi:hypothetical protein
MTPLAANAVREIESLHAAFVDLFTGRSRGIERCADALAPAFSMVTPDGVRLDRAAVLAGLEAATAPSDFRISISSIRVLWEAGDSVLLQYIEEQYRDRKTTRRLSTALLTAEARAPCGVVWRHLHETWMRDADGQ